MSNNLIRDQLSKLRWSVKTSNRCEIAPGLEVRLLRLGGLESESLLGIELIRVGRTSRRSLPRAHVETRGKSMWFADNTWRLSPAGLDFWSENLATVLEAGRK